MIPLRLQLHNFMSYGDVQPLDFNGIDLACLSGDNGVGKSTLLDAVTWVLWGKCRAAHDDDLVRQGAWDMWVSFEFDLEGQKYRVVRKRSKRRKGQGSLEFMVSSGKEHKTGFTASNGVSLTFVRTPDIRSPHESGRPISLGQESFGGWTLLTGTSKAETQQKIINTLRMKYDTFINSAFLRQGHADEFTIKRPHERKAILGEILGLFLYDQLETKVKERIKIKQIEKESLVRLLEDEQVQLKNKDKYRKEVEKIEKSLAGVSGEIKKKEEEVAKLQEKKIDLETKVKQIRELEQKIADFTKDIQDLGQDIKGHSQVISAAQKLIGQKDKIEEKFAEYKKNIRLQEEYDQKAKLRTTLVEEKRAIENKIVDAKHSLEMQRGKIQAKLESLKERVNKKSSLRKERNNLRVELESLEQKEKETEGLKKDLYMIREKLVEKRTELSRLKQEGEEIKSKTGSLSQAKAVCPLCKQNLSLSHRQEIILDLEQGLLKKREEYKSFQQIEIAYKQKVESLEEEIKEGKIKLSGKKEVENKLAEVSKDLREIRELVLEEEKFLSQDKALAVRIRESKYDPEDFKKSEDLEDRIGEIGYNEEKHNKIRENIKQLEKYGELKSKLNQARERMEDALKARTRIEEIVERKKEIIERDVGEKKTLTKNIEGLKECGADLG